MNEQNYANHARFVKGFHFVLGGLLLAGTISSIVNLWVQSSKGENFFSAVLITLLFICGALLFVFTREFPLKAQDRAIRAEESLRYFILTGKPFDSRITIQQIIALRFAQDEELIELTEKALKENLAPKEIKKAIKKWRPDFHRA